jgi:hypothetical protein
MLRRRAIALLCVLPLGAQAQLPIPAPEPAAPVPAAPGPATAGRPAPVASQAVPGPSPQEFLDDLYRPYLDKDFKGQPYWEAARFFEPVLAGTMEQNRKEADAAGKKPALNGDPFVDPHNWLITNLAVAATTGGAGATGTVLIVNQGTPRHITIALVPTPAGWRIADIRGGPVALRALYKLN